MERPRQSRNAASASAAARSRSAGPNASNRAISVPVEGSTETIWAGASAVALAINVNGTASARGRLVAVHPVPQELGHRTAERDDRDDAREATGHDRRGGRPEGRDRTRLELAELRAAEH